MSTFTTTETATGFTATDTTRYTKETIAEAEAACAAFPKSTRIGIYRGVDTTGTAYFYLAIQVKLAADAANGGTNETGLRRIAAFKKAAATLGHTLTPAE